VLNRAHERHYRDLVNEILPENLVIQPANRGTAPAILYGLMRLSEVARDAYVAVFPSDHFVTDDHEFMHHVDSAFDAIESRPEMTFCWGSIRTPWSLDTAGSSRANSSQLGLGCYACAGFGKNLVTSLLVNYCVLVACGTAS